MERYVPVAEMDVRFDEIMGFADAGETVFLTVDNRPDIVLMSVESYLGRFGPILSDEDITFLQSRHGIDGE